VYALTDYREVDRTIALRGFALNVRVRENGAVLRAVLGAS
jgi:hypothetical protein